MAKNVRRYPSHSRGLMLVCIALFASAPVRLGSQAVVGRPGSTQPVSLMKPRIPSLPEAQWTDVHRGLVAKYASDGQVGNDLRTLLNVPEMVDGLMPFNIYVSSQSSLSPRHREILILRTAWLTGSQYVWSSHAALARKLGLSTDEIRRVAQGPDARDWSHFEATLISTTDQLYRNSFINDATWKALAADYDMYHLMDAVMTRCRRAE